MSSLAILAATSTAADRAIRNQKQELAVRNLWITLASVLAFLTAIRILRFTLSFIFSPSDADKASHDHAHSLPSEKSSYSNETVRPGQNGKMSWRRFPSAIASAFRVVMFRLSIPIGPGASASVVELLFILAYIAVTLVLLFVDTRDLTQMFWQDRAAHLASCQLPLVVALAGKNNIISFLTGVSHEKLNILHRASARTCLLLLWIHAGTRAAAGLTAKFDFTHTWMRCGATGLTAFTLATVFSIRPIRNQFFEFFLITHIVLIGIFLITGYLHTRDPGFADYIWPAMLVWAFDRVLRGLRITWHNRFRTSGDHHLSTATVELLSSDTVRLTLRRKFNWLPGQHAYVILPTVSGIPTEAHPFTIASIPNKLDGTVSSFGEEKDVVFLIKGQEGFTKRLREHASANADSTVPAFIDGPYGYPPDLTKYSTCIIIAGGSGVSYALPLLLNLVHKSRANQSTVRRVVFVWSVRDPDHLKWISKTLNEALAAADSSSLSLDPRIYITGVSPPTPDAIVESIGYNSEKGSITTDSRAMSPSVEKDIKLPLYSALKVTHGRPSIKKIIQEEVSTASGPVSVDVAGPSGLTQSVRNALASKLTSPGSVLKGTPSVTLHTETFGMTR